jgi:gamma-glutamyl-gamma-aminobutyrate hydrolase PuuD
LGKEAELDAILVAWTACRPAVSTWTRAGQGAHECRGALMAERRELSDRILVQQIIERKMTVLAIGLGMQQVNAAMGGRLPPSADHQPKSMPHFDPSGGPHHMILLEQTQRSTRFTAAATASTAGTIRQ